MVKRTNGTVIEDLLKKAVKIPNTDPGNGNKRYRAVARKTITERNCWRALTAVVRNTCQANVKSITWQLNAL